MNLKSVYLWACSQLWDETRVAGSKFLVDKNAELAALGSLLHQPTQDGNVGKNKQVWMSCLPLTCTAC